MQQYKEILHAKNDKGAWEKTDKVILMDLEPEDAELKNAMFEQTGLKYEPTGLIIDVNTEGTTAPPADYNPPANEIIDSPKTGDKVIPEEPREEKEIIKNKEPKIK